MSKSGVMVGSAPFEFDTVPVDRVQVDDDAHWTAVVLARRGRGLRKVCVRGCGRERAGAKGVQNALEQVRCARGRSSDWTATIPSAKCNK